jgi:protease-4
LAAWPVGLSLGVVHRWVTGAAVLEVTIDRVPDAMDRALLLQRLRRAASDTSIVAVLMRVKSSPGNYAATEDLVQVIGGIRRAGTPVYAWVETPGNAAMWIASAADRVFVVPTGEVALVGVGVEMTFFGSALERLGLQPDFEAAGAYKSFGETFTRGYPSPENLEAVTGLVFGLHQRLMLGIAEGRGMSREAVDAAVEQGPLSAQQAQDAGLVDELMYEDQLESWLETTHGAPYKAVSFGAWALRDAVLAAVDEWGNAGQRIVVVHLDGSIVMEADGGGASIQARTVVPLLRALRKDEGVAAVVLNVNSPGGHALASDLMWHEVEALVQEKPVVACFEDVSASGGFYLAAPASEILVRPGTITGSIGVVGGKLVAGKGLRHLGVHVHEVAAAPNANLFSPNRRFTDVQRVRFKASLQRFYDGFVGRVAEGRNTSVEAVEPHCRGRVWTGEQAIECGLVDRLGDLDDAVDRARALAGLQQGGFARVDQSGDPRSFAQKQVRQMVKRYSPVAALALGELALSAGARRLIDVAVRYPGEALAMLPFDLKIR